MSANPGLWGIETAAQQLAQDMARALPVTIASVALWDQPSFSLTVKGVSAPRLLSMPLPVGSRVPLSSAPWHRVVFERSEPVLLEHGSQTPVTFPEGEAGLSLLPDLQSIYLVPIRVGEETFGVLGLGEMRSRAREPFTEDKRQRCRALLADFLAVSAHAWEAGRLRRQIRAMSSLIRMAKGILDVRSFQDVLAGCASEVADWLGTPVRGVLFRVERRRGVEIVGRWNFPEPVTEEDGAQLLLTLARGGGIGQWPIAVVRVADDPLDPLHAATQRGETWTRVSLPLMKADRLLGLACIYIEDELQPAEWELEAFRRRGEIAAVGMGLVATLQEHRTEHEGLGRAAYELFTTHHRAVLREVFAGSRDIVAPLLAARLQHAGEEPVGALGGSASWVELATAIADEIAERLADILGSRGRSEEIGPLELNQIVRWALEITKTKWREGPRRDGVSLELHFEPSAEPLLAETSVALVGALVHAIDNAVEALPEGGRIRVRTERDDGHAVISVEDSGPGVAEEFRQQAFNPLFSTKGEHHLGLGLSVVRAFATRHGAEATLSSGEGGGTTLVLRIPTTRVST